MDKNTITNKIDELNDYLDVLEDLIENDHSVMQLFGKDLSADSFNMSSYEIKYDKNLVDKGLIVLYEDAYYRPWQLKIYCEDYPYSQQFEYDCVELYCTTDNDKQSYAKHHEAKIEDCEEAQDNIIIEIDKTKKEIDLLIDKLELMI